MAKKLTWNGILKSGKGIMPIAMAAIMTMSGAAAMTNFAASSALPASATIKFTGDDDLEFDSMVVDDGNVALYDYLKSITPSDKGKLLVQQGESIEFDTSEAKPQIEEWLESGSFFTLR